MKAKSGDMKLVNIRVSEDLWIRARAKALSERKTLARVIRDLLEGYVGRRR